jgi:hypothetical protein
MTGLGRKATLEDQRIALACDSSPRDGSRPERPFESRICAAHLCGANGIHTGHIGEMFTGGSTRSIALAAVTVLVTGILRNRGQRSRLFGWSLRNLYIALIQPLSFCPILISGLIPKESVRHDGFATSALARCLKPDCEFFLQGDASDETTTCVRFSDSSMLRRRCVPGTRSLRRSIRSPPAEAGYSESPYFTYEQESLS